MLGPGVSILANRCTQEQEVGPGDRALHQGTEDLAALQFPLSNTCAATWEKTVHSFPLVDVELKEEECRPNPSSLFNASEPRLIRAGKGSGVHCFQDFFKLRFSHSVPSLKKILWRWG